MSPIVLEWNTSKIKNSGGEIYQGAHLGPLINSCVCVQPKSAPTEDDPSSSSHEEVANDLKVGISIRNLTKIYGQVIPFPT